MRQLEEAWNQTCPPNEDPALVDLYSKPKSEINPIIGLAILGSMINPKPLTKEELDYVTGRSDSKP